MALPTYDKKVTQVGTPRQTQGGTQGGAGFIASAQAGQSLAQKLQAFSSQMGNQAKGMAQDQAAKDATVDIFKRKQEVAKINSNPDLTSKERIDKVSEIAEGTSRAFSGVYSRAYESAASAAYSNQITTDAKAASDIAIVNSKGDSEAYAKQMKAFRDETVPNAPSKETGIVAEMAISQYGSAGYKSLKMAEIRRDEQRRHQLSNDTISLQSSDISNNIQEGDWTSAVVNLAKLQETSIDSIKNKWSSEERAQANIDKTIENGILSYVNDRFTRGEILDGDEFIQDFRDGDIDSEIPSEFFDIDRDKVADRMEYLLETAQKKADLDAKANAATTKEEANVMIGDGIKIFDAGKLPENLNDIESALPYASLAKQNEFKVRIQAYDVLKPYKNLSLPEQQAVLDSKMAGPEASRTDIQALEMAKKTLRNRAGRAKNDPMGLSFEEGTNMQSMSLAPGQDLQMQAQGLFQRAAMQTKNKIEYGEGATDLFTKQEAEGYSQWLLSPNTSIEQKLDFFTMIEGAIPSKSNSVYNQLIKKGSLTEAYAGSLLKEGKRDVAASILAGKGLLSVVENLDYVNVIKEKLTSGISDAMIYQPPSSVSSMIDATLAHAVKLAEEQGDITRLSNADIKKAIYDTTNGTHKRHDQSFFLPNNVTDDQFDQWIDEDLTAEEFSNVSNMTPEEGLSFTRDRGRIISVAPGKYVVYGKGKTMLRNKDGSSLVLSY